MHLLKQDQYDRVVAFLRDLPINTLFARVVAERQVDGTIWVDDPLDPRACYVWHPYGMSLLCGSATKQSFLDGLAGHLTGETWSRLSLEWLQVYPNEWSTVLDEIFDGRIVQTDDDPSRSWTSASVGGTVLRDTRVNFRFDGERHASVAESLSIPPGCQIIDDVGTIHSEMTGSVVPSVFWDDAQSLRDRGAAFALLCEGEIASAAFSAFTIDHFLELGVETTDRFRGRGFAIHVCRELIRYCLERQLEPVWACRLGNVASYRLALRLGFEHTWSLPYYRLPPSTAT